MATIYFNGIYGERFLLLQVAICAIERDYHLLITVISQGLLSVR